VHNEKDLELIVQSSRGSKEFTFLREAKIADVIATAAKTFGFSASDTFRIVPAANPGQPLQAERTLVSYHLSDGTVLVLTDVGSGV
jgi:hypothetical protein